MKVLHLPDSFFPWCTGGKEVFTLNLAMAQVKMDIEPLVVVHSNSSEQMKPGKYEYLGIKIEVLPALTADKLSFYNSKVIELPGFQELLLDFRPDIVHFHDQNNGASLTHLQIVKREGFKTVLTYHTAGQSCPQRALLFKGKYICDGHHEKWRCAQCLLTYRSYPQPLPFIFSNIAIPFLNNYSNPVHRIANIRSLVQMYFSTFKEIYSLHDKIQVHAKWCKDLLLLNGVPEHKIFFTKLGIPRVSYKSLTNPNEEKNNNKLKALFIGRCDRIKGVHVLITAIKVLPKNFPIELHILGPYWDTTSYGKKQLKRIASDKRFVLPKLIRPEEVIKYMQEMDLIIIPSICNETGPLVMLEALNVGLPVIGSNCGGIAENIINGENGWLFERGDANELAKLIAGLTKEKIQMIKKFMLPVRDINDMATDIIKLYKKALLNNGR